MNRRGFRHGFETRFAYPLFYVTDPLRSIHEFILMIKQVASRCMTVGSVPGCERKQSDMKIRTRHLFWAAMWVTLLLLPSRVWACACCAHPGEYQINFVKPDAYKLSVMERMRLGTTAYLFTGEAEPDDAAKGLAHPADTYSLNGSLVGNVWKLTFRNGDESGTLNLPLPAKMLRYAADIHDGRTKPGYPQPVL